MQITLYCIQKSTPGHYGSGQTIYFGAGSNVQTMNVDELTNQHITVYPNPFSENIRIETEFNNSSVYQVIDSKGKLILQGEIG